MKKIKYLFVALASVLFLVFLAATALLLLVNPNDYKPQLEQAVLKKTGRPFKLAGDLSLSFYPTFGFASGPFELGNPAGFSKTSFLTVGSAKFSVALLPLLQKNIEVDTITLEKTSVSLERLADGRVNWEFSQPATTYGNSARLKVASTDDPLLPQSPASPKKTQNPDDGATKALPRITVDKVQINEGSVHFIDHTTKQDIRIRNMQLTATSLQTNTPVQITASASIAANKPELTADTTLSATVTSNSQFDQFNISNLLFEVEAEGPVLPTGSLRYSQRADATLNLTSKRIDIHKSQASLFGAVINLVGKCQYNAPAFQGIININAPARKTLAALEIPYEATDPAALENITFSAAINATSQQGSLQNIIVTVDDTTLKGTIEATDFTRPSVSFSFAADTFNIDRYLPKKNETKQTAPSQTTKTPHPENTPSQPHTQNTPEEPQTPEFKTLAKRMVLDGTITVDQLTTNKLDFKNITLNLTARDGKFSLAPFTATLFGGQLSLKAQSDVNKPKTFSSANIAIDQLPIGPVLSAFTGENLATGQLALQTNMFGYGDDWIQLSKSLQGKGNLKLINGMLNNFELLPAKARKKSSSGPKQQAIDDLVATWNITNGKILNKDITLKADGLIAKGEGTIDIAQNTVNYQGDIAVEGLPTVPFSISGPILNPRYSVDLGGLIQNLLPLNLFEDTSKDKRKKKSNKDLEKLGKSLEKGLKGLFQ